MASLSTTERWTTLTSDPEVEQALMRELGLEPLVARVLSARGMSDLDEVRTFLTPSLERDWADPADIPGMVAACDRVQAAIQANERIAVFGDFDTDGMSSTALLTLALRDLGAQVWPFLPHRFGEGYGLSQEALDRVVEACEPQLVVTVDNGIAAANEVKMLKERGIDVVVTDHHEPSDLVPQGVPVTDPKIDDSCYSRELAGAGVALKMICELGRRLGQPDLWLSYTDLATLGTISDMMTLSRENRALVSYGIERMRTCTRPGLVALAAVSRSDLSTMTADNLPFSLVPRLNAAGRMGEPEVSAELLMTTDAGEATQYAARLEAINQERRACETELTEAAMEEAKKVYHGGRCLVLGGDDWHEGVKGIVASRLVNSYGVPTILFSVVDGVARGSGRSVGSVDLFHAVEECQDLCIRFGGHAGAVGVTIEADKLDAFRDRLEQVLSELPASQFISHDEVTAVVDVSELTVDSILSLERLQPFGQANRKPLFAVRGVTMTNRSCVGATGEHLRFFATDGAASVGAIMFRAPDIQSLVQCEDAVDVVFEPVAETWNDQTRPKMMVRDILVHEPGDDVNDAVLPDLVSDLIDRGDEILARDAYAGIADEDTFITKVVGVTFEGRQEVVRQLTEGETLQIVRQADNPVDPNAIMVCRADGSQVGFLRTEIARALAPVIDEGTSYHATVLQVTGGEDGQSLGVNIEVSRDDVVDRDALVANAARARASLAGLSSDELTDRLRQSFIGDHELLPAQAEALGKLARGRSTLCVMATGRGKSLIFHLHAARMALTRGKASVFVYPLRALVADQEFHLANAFEPFGMSVRVLTGETSQADRDEIFDQLANGAVDVVLTTPEFLSIHTDRFAASGRIGFVVVDEAHHAGEAKSGQRSAYSDMPRILPALGGPVALAVTATASTEVASEICRLLSIAPSDVIVDEAVRENLHIIDGRNARTRDARLVSIVATGKKTVIYVNSRSQSVNLARLLRRRIPDLGRRISFYNAGLTRAERSAVEEAFREGDLTCIISTSAFGEGVNLPDIRNVILYHLPFGAVEFNQMAGRAGRDGSDSDVFLLFGAGDAKINERIIKSSAPDRASLVALYKTLMRLQQTASAEGEDSFARTNGDIAELAHEVDSKSTLDEHEVSSGIAIFRELGFLTTSGFSTARRIQMVTSPQRMELERSIRYLEGMRAIEAFDDFRSWALGASADEMLARINRPIMPDLEAL